MRQPDFAHLTGYPMWRRCDHAGTRIAESPARVTLAPKPASDEGAVDGAAWAAVAGSAVTLACPPDQCAEAAVLLADAAGRLFRLADDGWAALPVYAKPRRRAGPSGTLDFDARADAGAGTMLDVRGIARDPAGRVWLLAPDRVRVLTPGLAPLDTLMLPAAPGTAVAASRWGVAVAVGARLLVQSYGGLWRAVALPAAVLALAADPQADIVAALLTDGRLAVLRRTGLSLHAVPQLVAPRFLLVIDSDTLLIGSPRGVPRAHVETRFIRARLDPVDGPVEEGRLAVRGFDGRALWRSGDTIHASTADGARALYEREPPRVTSGSVETFALDSDVFACVWHRVFIDACLPPGTAIDVEALTADDLPPRILWRPARPPADIAGGSLDPVPADDPWPPLGTITPDAPGWHPVGVLDVRAPMADIPDPPARLIRPSEEALGAVRSSARVPWPQVTLEGLIKAPPGRYLWLRLRLSGTERRSPAVLAIRASFQRPSLLGLLPSYWRADPLSADPSDRALALFEGSYTEIDARITALRRFADPALVPPEALDWLASHVALAFDGRVDEAVRRQLLTEAVALYSRRGTLPGLTRLLSILVRAPVQIIEGYRLRRRAAPFLGATNSGPIGNGFQLGDDDGDTAPPDDPADAALLAAHFALQLRRGAAGAAACPPGTIPFPIETDPFARFVRGYAHRFTVIVPCAADTVLAGVLETAIEANKPAHTLHRLCWLDAGYRLGGSSMVGIARLGRTTCLEPGIVGAAVLGRADTLGRAAPSTGFRPRGRIGRATRETIEEPV